LPANIKYNLKKILCVRTRFLTNQALISVLNGKKSERRPIWFMRQAGRYLPEYRKVREQAGSFLDLCYSPELACEVTLQPLRRYDLDAAIIFADILVVPHAMGNGLTFVEGEGPVLETVRSAADVLRLKSGSGSPQFSAVCESISRVRSGLDDKVGLIGFCGAPWTVASYMIEGRGSDRQFAISCAKACEPWFSGLMELLVENSIAYLCRQVEAGADVLQIFDSWAGELPGQLFQDFSIVPIQRIVAGVKTRHPSVPVIVFAKGAGARHGAMYEKTRCSAVGIEAEYSLAAAQDILPQAAVLQGNLDPDVLLGTAALVQSAVRNIVSSVPRDRHVFNLGHGIRQQTNPDILNVVIEAVRQFDGSPHHG
jgi:uroporphyrinogen decarboxylase